MDPAVADDILGEEGGEDQDIDEYGNVIPTFPHMLHANGDLFNLEDSDQVMDLQEQVKSDRNDLRNDKLLKYENHSTKWGGGGRARLLYDQVRARIS
jgi:hypothetical protein